MSRSLPVWGADHFLLAYTQRANGLGLKVSTDLPQADQDLLSRLRTPEERQPMGLIWLRTWYGDGSDAAFSAFNEVRDEETDYPVFQDAQRYDYGEDWKRFFTRAPQMLDPYSTSPVGYESTKQRALEECFQFEVRTKKEVEEGGYGIHWMVMYSDYYWKSKVGLVFVADEEMLRAAAQDPESAKVLAAWYDEMGRVVRHTRLTVDEASDVEMREQVMRGTNQESNEWLSAQPGEGYDWEGSLGPPALIKKMSSSE